MRQAAEHLTPVTLELGGKVPCIVDSSAKIELAAKRIVFGKFFELRANLRSARADYVYCHAAIHDQLVQAIVGQIEKQFGKQPLKNKNYGKIINESIFPVLMA